MLKTKKEIIFVVLAGVFITSAIVAELISCKQADIGLYPIIAGIVPWPFVFLLTDVMNEYYGKKALQRLSWITCGMIAFCFLIVFIAVKLPTSEGSYVFGVEFKPSYASDMEFTKIFGGSLPIMIGSITAFMVGQIVDVKAFWFMRKITGDRFMWLRSTGSTVISQLVDSYVVLFIGFYLPGTYSIKQILIFGITGYFTKIVIAVCLTPLIYGVHYIIKAILGKKVAEEMAAEAVSESLAHKK
ncbi:MAG: queuosine precursor transporter [Bacteroidia bacterium]|nr:queuosine precursor transporter [Bacteroidia bacterium]